MIKNEFIISISNHKICRLKLADSFDSPIQLTYLISNNVQNLATYFAPKIKLLNHRLFRAYTNVTFIWHASVAHFSKVHKKLFHRKIWRHRTLFMQT